MLFTLGFFTVLLIVSGIFSGTETAFTSVNEVRLMNQKKSKSVLILQDLIKRKRSVIAAILVGNNIVNTVLAVYAGAFFDQLLVKSGILSANLGPLVASIITIIFLLIFGEVVPKHFGVTFANRWMQMVSYPLRIIVSALKPVTAFMEAFSHLLMKLVPVKNDAGEAPTIQELLYMAKYSASAGYIDELERKLLTRSARFNDLEAKDIMIPRRQMAGVPENITLPELQLEISQHMYTRMPVYSDTIDNIVGIFNIKELLSKRICHDDNFKITEHCHIPFYAPESMSVGMLFESMRLKKIHIAIIVDEFGTAAGLITLEDIIERIFGLIHDEYDEESVLTIKKISDQEFEVRGRAALEELEVFTGIEFPNQITRKNNTVNGLLTYLKGDFPKERDKIVFERLTFTVEQTQGLRAAKVRVSISN